MFIMIVFVSPSWYYYIPFLGINGLLWMRYVHNFVTANVYPKSWMSVLMLICFSVIKQYNELMSFTST